MPVQLETRHSKASNDAFAAFMKSAARYPLLTPAQEIELGQKIRAWLDAKAPDAATIRNGQRARQRMIEGNIRLVVSIAKGYRNKGLEFPDLVQEGCLGLNRAAEKFDPSLGYKFSTYASPWIKQAMRRAINDHGRAIRLPNYSCEILAAVQKWCAEYHIAHGRYPNHEELATHFCNIGKLKGGVKKGIQTLDRIFTAARMVGSLDYAPGCRNGDDSVEIGLMLEDDGPLPEDIATELEMRELVRAQLQQLGDRQVDVLTQHWGLDGEEPRNLAEIGRAMGTSRESVRQVEKKAIRSLRRALNGTGAVELLRAS